jgi:glyoxylase-like metal-dependent hydrolase (beta-lactamase superfamily II)
MVQFHSEMVSKHLTRIIAPGGVCVYLVQGSQQAVLLDTGFGVGDLKGYVEELVQTPYTVLLSHGHLDHAGGAAQFPEVYLSQRDWSLAQWHCKIENRIEEVYHFGKPEGMVDEDFIPARTEAYLPLTEENIFHLGGVTVQPVEIPGHTMGMMAFLIPEDRIAIFGDGCGEHTLLFFDHCASIAQYQQSLLHLQQYADQFDIVLRNHNNYLSKKQILADNIELCSDILNRRDAAVPVEMHGTKGLAGRAEYHPGKEGNIFYNPQRIDS